MIYTVFLILFSFMICGTRAIRDISSKDLIKEMKFGWNLGNTLESYCYDYKDYSKDQTVSETCWGNIKTSKELYTSLYKYGFNIFRIPVTWTGHFAKGPDYKINGTWMKRVHEVVDYALDTGGFVIINTHHENWYNAFSSNLESAKTILKAIWTQIADEFADNDEHLIFECLNEPRKIGADVEWIGDEEGWNFVNELNKVCIDTIRSSKGNNSLRHIMIPTYAASANETVYEHYNFPSNDNKVIASVHSYSPYLFALDSSEWALSEFNKVGEEEIDLIMDTAESYLLKRNIPMIMGEFGSTDRNNYEDRIRWAIHYAKKATSKGIPCVLWDNGKFYSKEGDQEVFGYINRSSLKLKFPHMHSGFLCGLGDSKYCEMANDLTSSTDIIYSTLEDDHKNSEKEKEALNQNESTDNLSTSSIEYYHVIHLNKFIYFIYFIVLIIIMYIS